MVFPDTRPQQEVCGTRKQAGKEGRLQYLQYLQAYKLTSLQLIQLPTSQKVGPELAEEGLRKADSSPRPGVWKNQEKDLLPEHHHYNIPPANLICTP